MKLYILMREREVRHETSAWDVQQIPHCVCSSMEDIEKVVESIAANKDNRRYPMEKTGESSWKIGPQGDQGFFGSNAMRLWVVESTVRGNLKDMLAAVLATHHRHGLTPRNGQR